MKLNEFRVFLALRESAGVNNQDALAQITAEYNQKRHGESSLKITPSMQSRAKDGKRPRGEKHSQLLEAIAEYLEEVGLKNDKQQSLQECCQVISQDPKVANILLQYDLQKAKRTHLTTRSVEGHSTKSLPNAFSKEQLDFLLGCWHQVNVTFANPDFKGQTTIRGALRLIYLDDQGQVRTYTIGRTTYWKGEVRKVNSTYHVSEEAVDKQWGEVAHYVYKRSSRERYADELVGFVQVVSHYGVRHMFSGRTALCKSEELTKKYQNNFEAYARDKGTLCQKHCGHVPIEAIDDHTFGIPNLKSIISRDLSHNNQLMFDIIDL